MDRAGLQEGKTEGLKSPRLAAALISRMPEQRVGKTVRGRGACTPACGSRFSGHRGDTSSSLVAGMKMELDPNGSRWFCKYKAV